MKQKIAVKVQINCDKCRSKAMEVAAKQGVDSMAVEGEDEDLLVVRGDAVDPVKLVIELRKKVGHAKIVSVEEVDERGRSDCEAPQRSTDCCCSYYPLRPPPSVIVVHEDYDPPAQPCSIM